MNKIAVHQAVGKVNISGSYTYLKRSGRPRETNARDDNVIQLMVMRSLTAFCMEIKHILAEKKIDLSLGTIH